MAQPKARQGTRLQERGGGSPAVGAEAGSCRVLGGQRSLSPESWSRPAGPWCDRGTGRPGRVQLPLPRQHGEEQCPSCLLFLAFPENPLHIIYGQLSVTAETAQPLPPLGDTVVGVWNLNSNTKRAFR